MYNIEVSYSQQLMSCYFTNATEFSLPYVRRAVYSYNNTSLGGWITVLRMENSNMFVMVFHLESALAFPQPRQQTDAYNLKLAIAFNSIESFIMFSFEKVVKIVGKNGKYWHGNLVYNFFFSFFRVSDNPIFHSFSRLVNYSISFNENAQKRKHFYFQSNGLNSMEINGNKRTKLNRKYK